MHPSHNSQPYKYLFFHFCMLFQMVESNHTYHYIDILNSSLKKEKKEIKKISWDALLISF